MRSLFEHLYDVSVYGCVQWIICSRTNMPLSGVCGWFRKQCRHKPTDASCISVHQYIYIYILLSKAWSGIQGYITGPGSPLELIHRPHKTRILGLVVSTGLQGVALNIQLFFACPISYFIHQYFYNHLALDGKQASQGIA